MKLLYDADSLIYKKCFSKSTTSVDEVIMEMNASIREILYDLKSDDIELHLTGSNCRRRAKYSDYKGERPERPEFYQEAKDYLIQEWNALLSENGDEADDTVAMAQTEDTCIVAIDKDLNTIPYWHYNPDKKIKYWVSPEDAELFFWSQMIMGDTVDNIKGIKGKGKMAAYKILSEAKDYKLAVIAAYRNVYGDDFKKEYDKNYELLFIGKPV